jgi:hypothetical protein
MAAVMFAASPGHAGRKLSDRQAVQATVHEYLVRMGHLREGPAYERSMRQALDEMALEVGPFQDLAIEYLGGFLRNPDNDFDECTAAYGLPHFGATDPQQAVRVLIRGLPTRNDRGDRCVGEAMRALGPPGYPWLVRCAEIKGDPEVYWCLDALLDQSLHLPDLLAMLGKDELEPDTSRTKVQAMAGRWEAWYEKRADDLEWDMETQLLQEREP